MAEEIKFPVKVAWPTEVEGVYHKTWSPEHGEKRVKILQAHHQQELDALMRVGWVVMKEQ